MRIGGHTRELDSERLGPTLMLAASIILAIRTAKRVPRYSDDVSNRDWEEEFEFAVKLAGHLLATATHRQPGYFRHKDVPWFVPDDEDVLT